MAKKRIKAGSTEVTVYVFIQDSSSTTGAGLSGLTSGSAGLSCFYVRPLQNDAALALAAQTPTGAHTDGGFSEVDGTDMPGVYRLDLSDAVIAAGADSVVVMLKGATNMAPLVLELQLDNMAEPTEPPVANATIEEKINWMFAVSRNKLTQTATTQTLRNDGDTANIGTSAVSDDATTFTRAEWVP